MYTPRTAFIPEEVAHYNSEAAEDEEETRVALDAVPVEGYEFVCWEENDEQVSVARNYSFIVYDDRTLVARFAPTNEIKNSMTTSMKLRN